MLKDRRFYYGLLLGTFAGAVFGHASERIRTTNVPNVDLVIIDRSVGDYSDCDLRLSFDPSAGITVARGVQATPDRNRSGSIGVCVDFATEPVEPPPPVDGPQDKA